MDLSKYNHLPLANRSSSPLKQKIPVAVVDKIADELAADYDNLEFRPWYCGVIYEFGPDKVHEWHRRANEGKEPAKLFTHYVQNARTFHSLNPKPEDKDEA